MDKKELDHWMARKKRTDHVIILSIFFTLVGLLLAAMAMAAGSVIMCV